MQVFLKPRKSRLGPSKFTFNAEKFIRRLLFMSIWLIDFGAIRSRNVFCSPKLTKKSIKTRILAFKVILVIEFGASRKPVSSTTVGSMPVGVWKPVYDFLLVINSNLGLITHHYWDTATYCLKIANFLPPSYLTPSFGVTFFEFLKKLYGSWN